MFFCGYTWGSPSKQNMGLFLKYFEVTKWPKKCANQTERLSCFGEAVKAHQLCLESCWYCIIQTTTIPLHHRDELSTRNAKAEKDPKKNPKRDIIYAPCKGKSHATKIPTWLFFRPLGCKFYLFLGGAAVLQGSPSICRPGNR